MHTAASNVPKLGRLRGTRASYNLRMNVTVPLLAAMLQVSKEPISAACVVWNEPVDFSILSVHILALRLRHRSLRCVLKHIHTYCRQSKTGQSFVSLNVNVRRFIRRINSTDARNIAVFYKSVSELSLHLYRPTRIFQAAASRWFTMQFFSFLEKVKSVR